MVEHLKAQESKNGSERERGEEEDGHEEPVWEEVRIKHRYCYAQPEQHHGTLATPRYQ